MRDSGIAWINADMIFKSGKMDDVMIAPISWHLPGDPLLSFRQRIPKRIAQLLKQGTNRFRLPVNILIDGFDPFTAKMILVRILKFPSAPGAFPHIVLFSWKFVRL